MLSHKKKGDINVFIATIIAVFVLLVLFLISTFEMQPIVVNSKINQVARQAMLRMETDGGITAATRQKIIDGMNFKNFESSSLVIDPTSDITEATKADYGEEIDLKLTYTYKYFTVDFVRLTEIKRIEREKVIRVQLSTTSKNAR